MAAVGLTGVLASCGGVTVTADFGFAPGSQYAPSLKLNELSYSTNYQAKTAFTDQNGNTVRAGEYLICDNANTTMLVDLKWTGGLNKLYLQFKGLSTGATQTVPFYAFNGSDTSGAGQAKFTFGPNTAPLSLSSKLVSQAIVVNPVIVNVKGNTYVRVQGIDQSGYNSNILESVTAIPVVNCQ
ncbi:hypothetical protein GCM10010840_21040 [Deinococcus aerolatus]|uniref:Lipoprotein n=2 Tax=Deinococcus aerolatus TaxID=522487 RepID=A0ABQ2GAE5_9DEIO|nr:hypothetical protein GCM10010840_21040 [Deinococcus aerolatus]